MLGPGSIGTGLRGWEGKCMMITVFVNRVVDDVNVADDHPLIRV